MIESTVYPILQANYSRIQERIASACERSARLPGAVRLVAVTKYADWDWVLGLIRLGQHDLAENRPQNLMDRAEKISAPISWHLIGHLQSNKAKRILSVAKWIHSVDSLKLLGTIDRFASELPFRPQVLLEVNVTGETTKDGFDPVELESSIDTLLGFRHVQIQGLMTMAMASNIPETSRPAFRNLRELRDNLQSKSGGGLQLNELSMGMTGDFEIAIEEGATMVRIGSALFQGLTSADIPTG